MEELITLLNAIQPLSTQLRNHLYETIQETEILKKHFILKAGQVCRQISFISQGLVRCYYLLHDQEINSWFMKEGDIIISVQSFFEQKESYETIQALEDTTIYSINFTDLEYIYDNFPEFNYHSRVVLQKYYTLSEQRLNAIRMQRSHERFQHLIRNHPEIVDRVPNKHIASYLGITEETLSRIKKW